MICTLFYYHVIYGYVQVLYEFVFSVGGVVSPFKIYDSYPRMEIPMDAEKTISDSPIVNAAHD